MEVVIRTDASVEIGSGHVMRCLTLADQLRRKGAGVSFICRLLRGNMIQQIQDNGFRVYTLPSPVEEHFNKDRSIPYSSWLEVDWKTDCKHTSALLEKYIKADWLVVDHYAIGEKWERSIRNYTDRIMVIDDLADRVHDCDLLVDQNLYKNYHHRYQDLVPGHTVKLLGPKYMLVRDEFINAKTRAISRNGIVKRLLVSFGGTDPTNETQKVLAAIRRLNRKDLMVDVVVGSSNPRKNEVKQMCESMPGCNFYCQINNMADLMQKADLAFGAGGTSTWERCYLGLPAITIQTASNQSGILSYMAEKGALVCLGSSKNVAEEDIVSTLSSFLQQPIRVKEMAESAWNVVQGVEEGSVVRCMLEGAGMIDVHHFELRDLEKKDLPAVLKWRNSEAIREAMYTDHKITMEEHERWYNKVSSGQNTMVKLLYYKNQPIGLVNFSRIDHHHRKCYWGFYIGESSAPKGSGTVLGLLALEFIFEEQSMHKLCAEVLVSNKRSFQFHKKLGFMEEGRFINHTLKNGKYMDVIPMAHFKDAWPEAKKGIIQALGGGGHEQHSSSKT
ncbi:UDP-2,4-diacetamido-2,4,6-trideoxy-beta-L-altropyranose hydrolase [Halobacillus sp. Marseille-P3879]|uniref:UDP-2,4-diacetamido-2,4, 6-trideoxy-beta-L-altropyranose hydrolase n=1 Tax=Halobacillus sp. Marseille-P3879 TaxID=2045014 RepID=UPI000C7D4278|nr:UDP-2,4-diacetamido-2,4,6-trideoxy-beta-L-altropyranose hydrolase [Halobacillus sp. Marseille-P3879]